MKEKQPIKTRNYFFICYEQKQTKTDRNGHKRIETDRNGQKWTETDIN